MRVMGDSGRVRLGVLGALIVCGSAAAWLVPGQSASAQGAVVRHRMTRITDTIYRMSFMSLPSAQLKRIDNSAHFIMLDQPERFTAEVNAFLD